MTRVTIATLMLLTGCSHLPEPAIPYKDGSGATFCSSLGSEADARRTELTAAWIASAAVAATALGGGVYIDSDPKSTNFLEKNGKGLLLGTGFSLSALAAYWYTRSNSAADLSEDASGGVSDSQRPPKPGGISSDREAWFRCVQALAGYRGSSRQANAALRSYFTELDASLVTAKNAATAANESASQANTSAKNASDLAATTQEKARTTEQAATEALSDARKAAEAASTNARATQEALQAVTVMKTDAQRAKEDIETARKSAREAASKAAEVTSKPEPSAPPQQ